MDIQKYINSQTKAKLPITGSGIGFSKKLPVIITSEAKSNFIWVQNEYISTFLDDENWDKAEQSLIFDDDKKFDKITIQHFTSDGEVVERLFWFDITECFGIYIST